MISDVAEPAPGVGWFRPIGSGCRRGTNGYRSRPPHHLAIIHRLLPAPGANHRGPPDHRANSPRAVTRVAPSPLTNGGRPAASRADRVRDTEDSRSTLDSGDFAPRARGEYRSDVPGEIRVLSCARRCSGGRRFRWMTRHLINGLSGVGFSVRVVACASCTRATRPTPGSGERTGKRAGTRAASTTPTAGHSGTAPRISARAPDQEHPTRPAASSPAPAT